MSAGAARAAGGIRGAQDAPIRFSVRGEAGSAELEDGANVADHHHGGCNLAPDCRWGNREKQRSAHGSAGA